MTTTEQTRNIVHQFIDALSKRDLSAISHLFAEKVDWYIPGNEALAPWLGKRHTKQEVSTFFTALWKRTEPISAHLDHLFIEENEAVITGEFSTRMLSTGKVVNSLFSIQITVENNLITRYHLLEDSYAVTMALRI